MSSTLPPPSHVAFIMDGNGRWAEARSKPRVYGHIRGATRIKPLVEEAKRLDIKALTFYAFSTENWTRPEDEKSTLWRLLAKFLKKETPLLMKQNVQLQFLGQLDRLRPELQTLIKDCVAKLSKNTGLQLSFAVSYGSRQEILRATELYHQDCLNQNKTLPLSDSVFEQYLWTASLGEYSDVDLVIRTSGEKRVSNFLLWQSAYAEYYFIDKYWPDFSSKDFSDAIADYQKRDRRKGGIKSS